MFDVVAYLQQALDQTQSLQRGDWVELWQSPSALGSSAALLLCELADERSWVTWVPNFGELVVSPEQIAS